MKADRKVVIKALQNQLAVHLGMFQNKLFRHSIAFGSIVVASILLYPAAQEEESLFVWVLLTTILIAATLTIIK